MFWEVWMEFLWIEREAPWDRRYLELASGFKLAQMRWLYTISKSTTPLWFCLSTWSVDLTNWIRDKLLMKLKTGEYHNRKHVIWQLTTEAHWMTMNSPTYCMSQTSHTERPISGSYACLFWISTTIPNWNLDIQSVHFSYLLKYYNCMFSPFHGWWFIDQPVLHLVWLPAFCWLKG